MRFRPARARAGHCIPADPYYLAWRARTGAEAAASARVGHGPVMPIAEPAGGRSPPGRVRRLIKAVGSMNVAQARRTRKGRVPPQPRAGGRRNKANLVVGACPVRIARRSRPATRGPIQRVRARSRRLTNRHHRS
jgi:hypothetical protein